jgi:ABC-type Zn2+ transport system substrate-binding protein/surface adhesin
VRNEFHVSLYREVVGPFFNKFLGKALSAMNENSAAAIAALSGGEQLKFHDEQDFIDVLENSDPNSKSRRPISVRSY